MKAKGPLSVDEYILGFTPDVANILTKIRQIVRCVAPKATEKMSYNMPTFLSGNVLIHFAAFKSHIGIFPPVREPQFIDRVARYVGEKGNLRLPLSEPIPYDLIADIVSARLNAEADG